MTGIEQKRLIVLPKRGLTVTVDFGFSLSSPLLLRYCKRYRFQGLHNFFYGLIIPHQTPLTQQNLQ